MNQQIDIEKHFEDFRSEVSRLNQSVKDLLDDNARLNRRVAALNVEGSPAFEELQQQRDAN